jgi:hypothetical protein
MKRIEIAYKILFGNFEKERPLWRNMVDGRIMYCGVEWIHRA